MFQPVDKCVQSKWGRIIESWCRAKVQAQVSTQAMPKPAD